MSGCIAVEPAAVMLPVAHCVAVPPLPPAEGAAEVPAVAADVGAAVAAAEGDAVEPLLLHAAMTIEAVAIKTPKRAI
jgi:hypothetical protein